MLMPCNQSVRWRSGDEAHQTTRGYGKRGMGGKTWVFNRGRELSLKSADFREKEMTTGQMLTAHSKLHLLFPQIFLPLKFIR